jgi:hypothetical protein
VDFSILIPHLHTEVDKRALRVLLDTIVRHTIHDYELIVQAHQGDNAYPILNAMAQAATSEWLVFTCTDHFCSPAWDVPMWDARGEDMLVVGGLVESGFRLVSEQNLERNFGMSPETFYEAGFNAFAASHPPLPTIDAWTFPWLVHRESFWNMGGFDIHPSLSDMFFFRKWMMAGKQWTRVESYAYHLMNWTSTGTNR